MSNREENKETNRRKVLDAARSLMREGGLEALSMRALATRANVSSRTPYNLFGSKTAVLIGLLDAPLAQLPGILPTAHGVLPSAFEMLERVFQVYAPELDYYRNIYWGVMSSDHHAARAATRDRASDFVATVLALALEVGELVDVEPHALADHLVLLGLGLLGLWASQLIDGKALLVHLRLAFGQSLQAHASPALRAQIAALLAAPPGPDASDARSSGA